MTNTQREIYCNGHHDRMRGVKRNEAPATLREFWLNGWDSADGELYDRAINNSRAWCCRKGELMRVTVCPECAEFCAAYSAAM